MDGLDQECAYVHQLRMCIRYIAKIKSVTCISHQRTFKQVLKYLELLGPEFS
jgi:hypothetical protein